MAGKVGGIVIGRYDFRTERHPFYRHIAGVADHLHGHGADPDVDIRVDLPPPNPVPIRLEGFNPTFVGIRETARPAW